MSGVSSLKIGTRILAGFAGALALAAIIGGVGVYSLSSVGDVITTINKVVFPKVQLVTEVERQALETALYTQVFLNERSPETRKEMLDRLAAVHKALDQTIEFSVRNNDAATQEAARKAKQNMASYEDLTKSGLALIDKNDELTKEFRADGQKVIDLAREYVRIGMPKLDAAMAASDDERIKVLVGRILEATQVERLALETRISEKNYILWQQAQDWDDLKKSAGAILTLLDQMEPKQDDKEQVARIQAVRMAAKEYMAKAQQWVDNDRVLSENLKKMMAAERAVSGEAREDAAATARSAAAITESGGATADSARTMILAALGLSLLALVGCALLVSRSITPHIVGMTGAMRALADGRLETEVPAKERKDEIGEMAVAVQVFKDNAIRVKRLEAEQEEQKRRAEEERKAAMRQLADSFERSVGDVINSVTSAATELQASSEVQTGTAGAVDAIDQISKVIAEMSEISSSIASAVEEQTAATSEIARNVEQAATGTNEVTTNIASVEQAANETGAAANQIRSSATSLSEQAEVLKGEVGKFLDQVRADKADIQLLEWNDKIVCGVPSIDRDHHRPVDLLNDAYGAMMTGDGAGAGIRIVNELGSMISRHFADEEKLMVRIAYSGAAEHRRIHLAMVDRFGELKRQFERDQRDSGPALFNFVAGWLKEHTYTQDRAIIEFARSKGRIADVMAA